MTVSSLSKIILGVKNIVVEKVEIEGRDQDSQLIISARPQDSQLIISARPHKRDMCRCSVCGQKSPRYDRGNGIRRWRAPDFGSGMKVYVEAEAPRVRCPEHGVVVQQFPWARLHSKFTRNFEDTAVCMALASSVTQSRRRVPENQLGYCRTNHFPRGKGAVRRKSAAR